MAKTEQSHYPDGTLRSEATFVDGLPHGLVRYWHPNGVLAEEIPMTHGMRDGKFRQWNDKGELLGECEVVAGTGIERRWWPNGALASEMQLVKARLTGRFRVYDEYGKVVTDAYYINNRKVSKKRYFEACRNDPSLPKYEGQTAAPTAPFPMTEATEEPAEPVAQSDARYQAIVQEADAREAMAWLTESREPPRTLGENPDQDDAIEFAKKLYDLGAVRVHAIDIDADEELENTGRLIIELPTDARGRKKLFRYCGVLAQDQGYDPTRDVGQRYMLLMLD